MKQNGVSRNRSTGIQSPEKVPHAAEGQGWYFQ